MGEMGAGPRCRTTWHAKEVKHIVFKIGRSANGRTCSGEEFVQKWPESSK